jgi:hypothetical protein
MTNAAQLVGEHRSLIAGELHAAGGTFVNVNPATGRIVGHVADATPGEARHAIRAAREAFDDGRWAADAEFRQRCLLQPQSALRVERERLRELIVAESGSPVLLTQGAEWVELGLENDFPCARARRAPSWRPRPINTSRVARSSSRLPTRTATRSSTSPKPARSAASPTGSSGPPRPKVSTPARCSVNSALTRPPSTSSRPTG